jgi:hypothetical protein
MTANGAQELRLFENGGGPIIQVEINLEEAPPFMIRRKDEDSDAQTIESRSTALTRNGDRLEQYWKVTAHRDFGLPGAVDEAVFIAVMKLVSLRGGMPPDGRISFSLYELMKETAGQIAGSQQLRALTRGPRSAGRDVHLRRERLLLEGRR